MQRKLKLKNNKINCLSVISLLGCGLLVACNSGTTSNVTPSETGGLNIQASEQDKAQLPPNSLPSNCVEDEPSKPTVETCFYMPNTENATGGQLNVPSYAKYVKVLAAGGGGGGGGASALTGSMYNGGGAGGTSGSNGSVLLSNLYDNNFCQGCNLTIAVGGGGGGGSGGDGDNSFKLTGDSGEYNGQPGNETSYKVGGAGGGGGGGIGNFYTYTGTHGSTNGQNASEYCRGLFDAACYGYGGGGGGGGGSVVLSNNVIVFSASGGNGGNGANGANGGNGGNECYDDFDCSLEEPLPSYYLGTYQNSGATHVCNQAYTDSCDAGDGGAGFVIVTLSKAPVVSSTSNISGFNFISPSQNNICMLIKDNTTSVSENDRTIEVACSNNGHPVYIKTIAHPGTTLTATDDGSILKVSNMTQSLNFVAPVVTSSDRSVLTNIKFTYESALQEEGFASGNVEYQTTKVEVVSAYDPTDPTKIARSSILAPSGSLCSVTHGNISCEGIKGLGFALPSGNWINECYGSHYDGVTLTAICGGLTQSQYATPGLNSSCSVEGGSLTCTDKGFKYPSGTANYLQNMYPYWNKWSLKKDHFGGDILLSAVSGASGDTSTTLAASGSESYCKVVGVNDFLSCDPYPLPEGNWLQDSSITGAFYDGYNLIVTHSGVGGAPTPIVIAPNSGSTCSSSASGVSCN